MGSIGNPKVWVPLPYMNSKDCSQGLCSFHCPQWCYFIFPHPPPPPPPPFGLPDSGPSISPIVIAIIGVMVSAFLLISYYTIISKYCGNNTSSSSARLGNHDDDHSNEELDEENYNHHQSQEAHEPPWHVATATGLDEATIKSIGVCKYKKGEGLVQGTDCSVCLGEFREDEILRLLPKCTHAFHVMCIDTWLKSHSNCPLCRTNIVSVSVPANNASLPPPQLLPPPAMESFLLQRSSESPPPPETGNGDDENVANVELEGSEGGVVEVGVIVESENAVPKNQLRALSDLGNSEQRQIVIEIRDGDVLMGRSISMDHLCRAHVSVGDVLRLNGDRRRLH